MEGSSHRTRSSRARTSTGPRRLASRCGDANHVHGLHNAANFAAPPASFRDLKHIHLRHQGESLFSMEGVVLPSTHHCLVLGAGDEVSM